MRSNIVIKSLMLVAVLLLHGHFIKAQDHPSLFVKNQDRETVLAKIENEEWAKMSWQNLKKSIDGYVDRHQTDPEWIVSRLAMYWKDGERYTQCYIKKQNWDYGEGNAPVPTMRLPGMRTWNNYVNVPLEDRIPYNESGDMLGIDRSSDDKTPVKVPYKKSGHMITKNNREILQLAEKSAFAYWLTQDEKYAKFSADIFNAWLLGTYYMQPPLDPEESTGGQGGYKPGGIMGYYDYEQIHDFLQIHAAITYDFIFDYLKTNQAEHLSVTDKDVTEVAGVVFKRFIELGLVRGGKRGNWNVNGFKNIVPSMLVLESDEYYQDGKGKEHYVPYYTRITTDYHEALPDFLKNFSEVTGLWPESPGYASGMISAVLDIGMPLYNAGINTIGDNPILQKAAMANLSWLDARGNLVVFGDMRGGPTEFSVFDRMLTYYTWENDPENARKMATVIRKGLKSGQYNRSNTDWKGLCLYQPLPESGSELPFHRAAYSRFHRHLIMKNGNSEENGMMFTLYGGKKGGHLTDNGLAMQFYGNGWALAPDASAYESYWSSDAKYHRSITGSNTILPGYTMGDITINAMDPYVDGSKELNSRTATSPYCSFADVSAEEKRRLVAMVRTSETTGYYVDVFRSDQEDNDYLHHNLGDKMWLKSTNGEAVKTDRVDSISNHYQQGYQFFKNVRKTSYGQDFNITWTVDKVSPALIVDMWMMGQDNREIYLMDAPPTTLRMDVTPGMVNRSPQLTPATIIRQTGNNAKLQPFVAVFESYNKGEKSVNQIYKVAESDGFIALSVTSNKNTQQLIVNSIDNQVYEPEKKTSFQGVFGIVSEKNGVFDYLYLGKGKMIKKGKYSIQSLEGEVSAELRLVDGKLFYTADKQVKIGFPKGKTKVYPAGYNMVVE
ncbi:hypothetical protein [Saccharicrinis sp. 156]|uniref:hypothetical protein n=1 Tax=Saccharicrinis sp. 156 TaxID=3417574 RepID=UPI003D33EED2